MRNALTPSGYFVLRQSLLPFQEILEWGDGVRVDASSDDEALCEARATLRERLRRILERPEVAEALFLASPDLHERIGAWLEKRLA